jgi:hypothetical protein
MSPLFWCTNAPFRRELPTSNSQLPNHRTTIDSKLAVGSWQLAVGPEALLPTLPIPHPNPLNHITNFNPIDDVHAVDDVAEGRVTSVEMRLR